MFGIVIFYPAGQPIRNRSGAEKCRMHGVPCCRISLAPSMFDPLGVERPQGAEPKNKTICLWQMVLFLAQRVGFEPT